MKKIVILLLLSPIIKLQAQDEPYKRDLPLNDENKIEFVEVIEVPNKSKNDLYLLSKNWIIEHYNSANDVIQMDDKDAGIIAVKGIYLYDKAWGFNIEHILKIQIKDYKIRVILGNLIFSFLFQGNLRSEAIEVSVIDELYNKRGKPIAGNKQRKEALIEFWENTKKSIEMNLSKNTNKEDW